MSNSLLKNLVLGYLEKQLALSVFVSTFALIEYTGLAGRTFIFRALRNKQTQRISFLTQIIVGTKLTEILPQKAK